MEEIIMDYQIGIRLDRIEAKIDALIEKAYPETKKRKGKEVE